VNGSTAPIFHQLDVKIAGHQRRRDHLYDIGHRKIAHVTGPEGNVLSSTRKDAFVAGAKLNLALKARMDHCW
jgi:DNA-binding LacI/PurR family transcriptional regulator